MADDTCASPAPSPGARPRPATARRLRAAALVMLAPLAAAACGGGSSPSGAAASAPAPAPVDVAPGREGSGSAGQPAEGGPCSEVGAQTGIQNGTLVCTDAAGGPTWQRMTMQGATGPGASGSAGNASDPGPGGGSAGGRVGEPCAANGSFGYGDGMVTVCASGRFRYALPEDVPAPPAGGHTSRPAWYPTLGQIFGPRVDECSGGPLRFTRPILEPAKVTRSMPAGMMIHDHVTPIDHMYVGISALDRPEGQRSADAAAVFVPADGTIIEASSLGSPTSHRVVVVHGCGIVSVYMVLNRLTGALAPYADEVQAKGFVSLSLAVKAGDEIGTQTDNPLDFNIFDGATWLPRLANPYSYAQGEPWKPYTADPFPYFANGTGDALRESSQRTAEPRWGVIDRDVPGTAAGSWFVDGTVGYNGLAVDVVRAATSALPGNMVPGKTTYAWGHLSLAPHPVDEGAWMLSTGWWSDPRGDPKQVVLDLSGGLPAPDRLTPAAGVVAYPLADPQVEQPAGFQRPAAQTAPDGIGYTVAAGRHAGWLLVQVLDGSRLAVEIVPDAASTPTDFGPTRRSYHR